MQYGEEEKKSKVSCPISDPEMEESIVQSLMGLRLVHGKYVYLFILLTNQLQIMYIVLDTEYLGSQ